MKPSRATFRSVTSLLGAASLVALLAGCNFHFHMWHRGLKKAVAEPIRPSYMPAPLDLAKVRPNEAGMVPILMFHQIIPTGQKPKDLEVPSNVFRADMEKLYSLGYRPVNLSDYVEGKISCPPGTSPVILTFDDAVRGQLDYTPDGKIDPNCAVGVLQAMHTEHTDWPMKGTFFVLPRKGMTDYFYQPEYSQAKLQWLAQNGFELGNHTIHHLMGMNHWQDARVEQEFAGAKTMIDQNVPNYKVDLLALPYGVFPKNKKLVISGQAGGVSYHNICALRAEYNPAPSPVAKDFNPYYLPRIEPEFRGVSDQRFMLSYWLNYLQKNPMKRYVSDGDPNTLTVPAILAAQVDQKKVTADGLHLRTY
ncbi:MAG TPA: polysaccharide deacetylase family protein [Capsulimonadaceae bacterium]|nr:polysaccharide deacetylase family protein [Capsulimonadaceae bacterium]